MTKKAGKRTNPRRIPLSAPIDMNALIAEQSTDNMYHGWLLVLPSLLELDGITAESVSNIWGAVNEYASHFCDQGINLNATIQRAEHLMGYPSPYKDITSTVIRSQGELLAVKRKIREKALHSALCIICLGLQSINLFDEAVIRRVFLNASITLAEIQSGVASYLGLAQQLHKLGVNVQADHDDMVIVESCGQ